jgi:hypothetical protein
MNSLTYDQARTLIEDGDVVLFQGAYSIKHPIDTMIMLVTGSPFVHCNIAFWEEVAGQHMLMAVEAQGGTKRRILNESFYSTKKMVVIKGVKDWNSIAPDALSKVAEQKYSYITAVYAGLRDFMVRVFGWRLPKMSNPGEICSEFVARLQGLSEIDLSPGDLYKALLLVSKEKALA